MIIVQIYEVQEPLEVETLLKTGVNTIGSVILSDISWKQPLIRETVKEVKTLNGKSSLIPLFSDFNTICRTLEYYRPDIVHFCEALINKNGEWHWNGHNDCEKLVNLQGKVRERFPETEIMRSIPIPAPGISDYQPVIDLSRKFESVSDYFLTDTLISNNTGAGKPDTCSEDQPVSGFVGITGCTCDWNIAARLVDASRIPVILAGGISPDNVVEGIKRVRPAGVDSCTQTNATDSRGNPIRFKKDIKKVKRFVEEIRNGEGVIDFYKTINIE